MDWRPVITSHRCLSGKPKQIKFRFRYSVRVKWNLIRSERWASVLCMIIILSSISESKSCGRRRHRPNCLRDRMKTRWRVLTVKSVYSHSSHFRFQLSDGCRLLRSDQFQFFDPLSFLAELSEQFLVRKGPASSPHCRDWLVKHVVRILNERQILEARVKRVALYWGHY